MKKFAVIVAGGKGERFGAPTPKQFILLNGKPILQRTLEAFENIADEIILVLPEHQIDTWEKLSNEYNITVKHSIVNGGKTRFQSVANALKTIEDGALVAVHDGVRPLISENLIINCYNIAELKGSAVTYVGLKDSIREVVNNTSKSLDRSNYKLIQTPQVFHSTELKQAYNAEEKPNFTDDASVMEAAGHTINLIEGEHTNIKITLPIDLSIAETLLGK